VIGKNPMLFGFLCLLAALLADHVFQIAGDVGKERAAAAVEIMRLEKGCP